MRVLLLPFFLLRLGFALSPFLLKAFWLYKKGWILVTACTSFFAVQLCLAAQHLSQIPSLTLSLPTTQPSPLPFLNSIPDNQLYTVPLKPEVLTQEQKNWEKYYQLQPQHRDILLNLSLLSTYTNYPNHALEYFQKARKLDPNHPVFEEQ